MERYSDDERQSMRPQQPRPERVAAAQARLLHRSSLAYRHGYAAVVASRIRSCGAAIAATVHYSTGSKNARLKIHFIGIISYFFKTISGANSMVIA